MDCADDADIAMIKKDIAAAKAGLSKLEQQEKKYAFELEAALSEYAALKEQGADFEPTELYAPRMALRPEKTASAVQRIQSAYGEKFDPLLMFDSKRDANDLLHEENESRAYRGTQRQKEQRKHENTRKVNHKFNEQER